MILSQKSFVINDKPYSITEVDEFLAESIVPNIVIGSKTGKYLYNVPCSFDIETTSFYIDENGQSIDYQTKKERMQADKNYNPQKCACMYVWQFGINGRCLVGRTWLEFVNFLDKLSEYLVLSDKRRLYVYVHNLAFEFQFMRKWLKWKKIFAVDERKPVYAVTENGIEFRCSYLLSNYSLANLGKNLLRYKVQKQVGDLDYSKLRHSKTELTPLELKYAIYDILVVMAYIQEQIEDNGNLFKLPLTNTGFVRAFCRDNTIYLPNSHKRNIRYFNLIHDMRISGLEEFQALQRAFQGGFTHCNALYSDTVVNGVTSYDFTSSYPYAMLSEKYPMSSATVVEITSREQFFRIVNDDKFCSIFDIRFDKLFTKIANENYISFSKCFYHSNPVINNGRVVCADCIETTITNVDFNIIQKCYSWESMSVKKVYVYKANYLPVPFLKCILSLYKEKTKLKGVEGREVDYMRSKNMLNSCYGMAVTSPLRPIFGYEDETDEWDTTLPENPEEVLAKNNETARRFLFYPWGVFVTAYARRNLFTAILSLGNDYVYSDTDSVKIKNADKHQTYFKAYDTIVEKKLRKVATRCKLDFDDFQPTTIKGEQKMLGVWDCDGEYDSFKTLGAKRYMYSKNHAFGEYPFSITVSGVNKAIAIPYLWELANHDIDKVFDLFADGLKIPEEYTGKNLHTYIDDMRGGSIVDYKGEKQNFTELSSIALEPTGYNLSMASYYVNYIRRIQTILL